MSRTRSPSSGCRMGFNKLPSDFPDGLVVGESTCQCTEHAFDPRSGKIPRTEEQLPHAPPNYGTHMSLEKPPQ